VDKALERLEEEEVLEDEQRPRQLLVLLVRCSLLDQSQSAHVEIIGDLLPCQTNSFLQFDLCEAVHRSCDTLDLDILSEEFEYVTLVVSTTLH